MANLGTTFDASTVDPTQPFEVLPPGKYVVQIVASEMRVTKDGQGRYLWLELDVLEGDCAGRKLFDRLNLINNSPATVEFAQRTLSAICRATGRMQVQDSEDLHLVPMLADVKVQPPKNGYGESNSIRYLPLERGVPAGTSPVRPAAPAPAPVKPAVQAQVRPATAPWRRMA